MSIKEPNYQSNIFHRYSVKQQHINMFIGYVFGRFENEEVEILTLCQEWIDKFDLDIDPEVLYNSYKLGITIFKDCIKAEKLQK